MRGMFMLLISIALLLGSARITQADKPVSFYYKYTVNHGSGVLQSDGIYQGDRGLSAAEQQSSCLEYIKQSLPPNTHFQQGSCTPISPIVAKTADISGPWGVTINQYDSIRKLNKQKKEIQTKISRIKQELDSIIASQTLLQADADALNKRISLFQSNCNKEFKLPDEQTAYDACAAEYNLLQQKEAAIKGRDQTNKKKLQAKMSKIDDIEVKSKTILWDIDRRIKFQDDAKKCIVFNRRKVRKCLQDSWSKLTRGF